MRRLVLLSICLSSWFFLLVADGHCEIYEIPHLSVTCAIDSGGPIPTIFPYKIRLEEEDWPEKLDTWGTGAYFDGKDGDGKENCFGDIYPYSTFVIDAAWTFTVIPGLVINGALNNAYWNYYYGPTYTKPLACDYSQNCHGFAYGVGDWPRDFSYLAVTHGGGVGPSDQSTGGDFENHPIGSGFSACWQLCEKKDAQVASSGIHSISVNGAECDIPEEWGIECVTVLHSPFGGNFGVEEEDCKIQAIVSSAEQFRESGTYTRTSDGCPDSLNVGSVHNWTTFGYFKYEGDF